MHSKRAVSVEDVERSKREVDEVEALRDEVAARMDQFSKFLIENFEPEEAQKHADKVSALGDFNDSFGSVKRAFEYIDSVMASCSKPRILN